MSHITTCTACGRAYEESSTEAAHAPDRLCKACWQAKANAYRAKHPEPVKTPPNTCRACGKEIVFLTTRTGSKMPTDAETVEPGDELFDPKRHTAHWATCPEADQFRSRR
jgi:hypothetical protein